MYQFKVGDKVMIKNYKSWGEGVIIKITHYDYGDEYSVYFKSMDLTLPSIFHYQIYQTLEQQIISHSSNLPVMCEPIEPIIFATSKADDETIKIFSKTKGEIEFEIHKPNLQFKTVEDLLKFLYGNMKTVTTPAYDRHGVKLFEIRSYETPEISFEFKNGSTIQTIQDGDNIYRLSGRGSTFEEFDLDTMNEFFKNITIKGDNTMMPNITNYKYTEDTAVTTIEWSDGTKTTVRAEYPETADPYTGFVTACAKKAFGNNNTINKLFDEWAVKKPEREMKAKIKANAAELEAKRIAEKRKAKREKWLIRRRAAEINREYEARKIAHEKYGVPMDGKESDNN